jgi:hypothetical protein
VFAAQRNVVELLDVVLMMILANVIAELKQQLQF